MKQINKYILESSSLFDSGYELGDIPQNYLKYEEGDKTFGELKNDDIVYLYNYSNDNIREITINGTLKVGSKKVSIKTKSFKLNPDSKYCKAQTELKFGPLGQRSGSNGEYYSPQDVEKSSICVAFTGGYAFGTNKETVRKYAKNDINNSIAKIQKDIENLQNEIESLNKKLENI